MSPSRQSTLRAFTTNPTPLRLILDASSASGKVKGKSTPDEGSALGKRMTLMVSVENPPRCNNEPMVCSL